ncbi:MAG: toll/interleukin-1 receptor domain-containing protein, partial [Silvibacterium sp.]
VLVSQIFISYRRNFDKHVTQHIGYRLSEDFGSRSVFIDTGNIPAGVDFPSYLNEALSRCRILIVIIGKDWAKRFEEIKQEHPNRTDYVKVEVSRALERNLPVIPVLIDGAPMPHAEELPKELQRLTCYNVLEVRSGIDFTNHLQRLRESIVALLNATATLFVQFEVSGGHTREVHIEPTNDGEPKTYAASEYNFQIDVPLGESNVWAAIYHTQIVRVAGTTTSTDRSSSSWAITHTFKLENYLLRVVEPKRSLFGHVFSLFETDIKMTLKIERLP